MNSRRDHVAKQLAEVVARLDRVLKPWGFVFIANNNQSSHCGPFASGHNCRDKTHIGIACRDTIDNIYYEHSFSSQNAYSTESERFTIGHATLMDALRHSVDCHLVTCDNFPDLIAARDGGDRVDALVHDLNVLASRVLCEPCDEFYEIVRRGRRVYSIA